MEGRIANDSALFLLFGPARQGAKAARRHQPPLRLPQSTPPRPPQSDYISKILSSASFCAMSAFKRSSQRRKFCGFSVISSPGRCASQDRSRRAVGIQLGAEYRVSKYSSIEICPSLYERAHPRHIGNVLNTASSFVLVRRWLPSALSFLQEILVNRPPRRGRRSRRVAGSRRRSSETSISLASSSAVRKHCCGRYSGAVLFLFSL